METQEIKHDIYQEFFLKFLMVLGILGAIFLLYKLSSVLFLLIFSLFLSVLISPILNTLNRFKVGDLIGIILVFLFLLLIIFLLLFSVIPLVVKQFVSVFATLSNTISQWWEIYSQSGLSGFHLPDWIVKMLQGFDMTQLFDMVKSNATDISKFFAGNVWNFLQSGAGVFFSLGQGIFQFFLIIIFTFFIVLERKKVRNFFYTLLPERYSRYFYKHEKEIVNTLFEWGKGQVILWVCMFVLTWLGLLILKLFGIQVEGILTLAFIAGFMEFIPYIGTFLSFAIALWVSFGSGTDALWGVIVVYLIIQQIEGNFLVPYVMGKTLALSPFLILVSMMIWATLMWVVWVVFTIPVVCIIQIFSREYFAKRHLENESFLQDEVVIEKKSLKSKLLWTKK